LRSTFVIDEEGVVTRVLEKVSPRTHDDDVLAALTG
jgi:peroxiredoxin